MLVLPVYPVIIVMRMVLKIISVLNQSFTPTDVSRVFAINFGIFPDRNNFLQKTV